MHKLIYSFAFILFSFLAQAQYWQRTNASIAAVGNDTRLLTATTGDTIYALARSTSHRNIISTSLDQGQTWSTGTPIFDSLIDGYLATITEMEGVENRLYISVNLSNSNFRNLYYYSEDLGASWNLDTAGLPKALDPSYKKVHRLKTMGNGYIAAITDFDGVYIKQIGQGNWALINTYATTTQLFVQDMCYAGNTWYALNSFVANEADRITKSTDFGQTWTSTNTSLPTGFAPYNFVSNHINKFYLSGSIAGTDANVIQYSTDDCATWSPTNSANFGSYSTASVYLRDLYAVDDYVFATFFPNSGDTVSRILISSDPVPNFSLCSIDGLPIYPSTQFSLGPPLLSYFHIGPKLFIAYADDLYTSSPGFVGGNPGIGTKESPSLEKLSFYPNPAKDRIKIEAPQQGRFQVFSIDGTLMQEMELNSGHHEISLNLPQGLYLIHYNNELSKLIIRD